MKFFWKSSAILMVVGSVLAISAYPQEQKKDLELKACGPKGMEVSYVADTDKHQHPTPAQPADKALIYVLRPSMLGNKIQSKLAVDGNWKGVNRGNNYFFFMLDPGEHFFCSVAENHSLLTLKLEAGKTYYIQQHIEMGLMKARNELGSMNEEEGQNKLAKAHLATWTLR